MEEWTLTDLLLIFKDPRSVAEKTMLPIFMNSDPTLTKREARKLAYEKTIELRNIGKAMCQLVIDEATAYDLRESKTRKRKATK
ncbi:hypothetical protein [Escherichia coli]|uniref:hypothetical protein n=1 Tax=Escherichia coli TaxID=562 RepID=UPI001CA75F55|nr:hypothetical protein [Escherichia coli]QZY67672.1 hypothetical protein K7X33_16390 [Escherichia coli]